MKSILVLFSGLFVLCACQKDNVNPSEGPTCLIDENDCLPFETDDAHICYPGDLTTGPCDYFVRHDTISVSRIMFDPGNSNHIGVVLNKVFLQANGAVQTTCCLKFQIYNHQTAEKIFEHTFDDNLTPFGKLTWSINSELLFASQDDQIYSLDLASGELNPIIAGSHPMWSPDGEVFIFRNDQSANPLIANTSGEVIDTIPFPVIFNYHGWSESNKLYYDMSIWDFAANENYSYQYPFELEDSGVSGQKLGRNDDEMYVNNERGIKAFSTSTGIVQPISEYCSGKFYTDFDVSKDGNFAAAIVGKLLLHQNDTIAQIQQLRIMNSDGTNECIVPLTY